VLDTTLCDKVCQWLAAGRWFSLGTLVSSTNKIDRHDITEILLKVALNTTTVTLNILMLVFCIMYFVFFVLVLWFLPIVGYGSGLSILDCPSTFSNFIKRDLYFYQILFAFSKLKITSKGYWFIFEQCHENTMHLINNIHVQGEHFHQNICSYDLRIIIFLLIKNERTTNQMLLFVLYTVSINLHVGHSYLCSKIPSNLCKIIS